MFRQTGNTDPGPSGTGELLVTGGGGSGGNVDLVAVGGEAIELGQATMAASMPVVIASDQTPIPVITSPPNAGHTHLNGSGAYTDQVVVPDPGDGFQAVITNIIGSTGEATALNFFLEEGSTTIFGPIYLEAVNGRGFASGPIYLPVTASTAVTLTSSAAIPQSFDIEYFVQAV